MISIFDRVHDAINNAFDGDYRFKEYVCVLSPKDFIASKQEFADRSPMNNSCTFDFAPSKTEVVAEPFFSINSNGITIHFKMGDFSYIGPVVALK